MRDLRVAVVGAGPAGVYASDILLRELAQKGEELGIGTVAQVDIFEKLPVPFGLVRYGVAPDHPAIKFIIGALEKTLNNPQIRLLADVEFGRDVTLDDLRARYDAVIFATGAVDDRPLLIPGHELEGVYGAAEFVEWYDGYPQAPAQWKLDAEQIAVLGGGNVAMDVSRLLVRYPEDLLHTDIPDNVYEGLDTNKSRDVHVFIRRDVTHAKFSVQELRELEELKGVQIITNPADFEIPEDLMAVAQEDKLTRQMVEELQVVHGMAQKMKAGDGHEGEFGVDCHGEPARRRYFLHFNMNPVEVLGDDGRVVAVRAERTVTDVQGRMTGTGEFVEFPVQAVYHAIGYKPAEVDGVPYDEEAYTLRNNAGRIVEEQGTQNSENFPFVYATGWAKRGPVGLIGSTKSDALETVTHVLTDWSEHAEHGRVAQLPDEDIVTFLQAKGVQPLDFEDWKRVDTYERAMGAQVEREHIKVIDEEQLRRIARGEETFEV